MHTYMLTSMTIIETTLLMCHKYLYLQQYIVHDVHQFLIILVIFLLVLCMNMNLKYSNLPGRYFIEHLSLSHHIVCSVDTTFMDE